MTQDLDLEVYDSSGRLVGRSINGGTRTDFVNLSNASAGDYYVRVFPGVSGARSAYALRFGLTVS